MKKILILGFIVLFAQINWSQTNRRFKGFNISNGLSQSYVTDIVQDESGFIWLCTQDGVNKFDGYSFRIYSADRTNGISSNYFNCGIKAKNGLLWFGTQQGLVSYDPKNERFESYIPDDSFADKTVTSIVENQNGILYVLFDNQGVYTFDLNNKIFKLAHEKLKDKSFEKLNSFNDDGLFIITDEKGIILFKDGQVKQIQIKDSLGVILPTRSIEKYTKNEYLITVANDIYCWNKETQTYRLFFPNFKEKSKGVEIGDLKIISENLILIGTTSDGLIELRITQTEEKFVLSKYRQDIFQKNTLLNDQITSIFKDRDGQVWVGTQRGFSTFNPNYLGFLGVGPSGNLEQGLPTPSVWSFAEDSGDNYLFVGTSNGISRFDRKKNMFNHFYREKTSSSIRRVDMPVLSLFVQSNTEIYTGGIDGFYLLSINKDNVEDYSFQKIKHHDTISIDYERVYRVIKLDDNHFWLATRGGICIYDKVNKEFIYSKESNELGAAKEIYADKNGGFWFAPTSGGVYTCGFIQGKIKIEQASFTGQLSHIIKGHVNAIYQSNKGIFWLATYGDGLVKVDPKTNQIEQFDVNKGLPNNVVYGVLEDDKEYLWLSTNRGLAKFSKKTETFVNYSEVDGLMSNEFNIGAYFKANNGELFFGGIYGYNHFFPSELQDGRNNLTVFLTDLKIANTKIIPDQENGILSSSIAFTKEIYLNYRQKNISIHFASNDLANASLVEYRYILEGHDDEFSYIGNENSILLSSLSPGYYELKIYAKSVYGEWSNQPTTLIIIVEPPFWMTWWFRLIVVGAILIVLIVFYRMRLEKQRRRMVQLEMKILERTTEIREQSKKIEEQNKKIQIQKEEVEEKKLLLEQEKEKVEKLLHNILPEETAKDLRDVGSTKARGYSSVSVMFTDFVGFTKIAEVLSPEDLLKRLDLFFSKFDEIIEKWSIEKIKTVGDAYLCAGGMPIRTKENPIQTVLAGLEIQKYMREQAEIDRAIGLKPWQLRIGINTGEIIAGVVGKKRYAYDIWGATVNLAQRMETNSKAGCVNISESTYEAIEPYFECTHRGEVMTKNSGLVNMYFVDRIKPELSEDKEGFVPNERFWKIVDLHLYSSINYMKAEKTILKLLEEKLSKKLYYHSIWHTKDVTAAVERIALNEGITDEGLFLLKSAASYHDAGFMHQYDKNEPIGVELAEEHLPKHGYSEAQIEMVKELIYVTQIPHQPKTKLQEIICDADLDYLGRDDFHEIADKLRRELREHGKIDSDRKWDEIQLSFLMQHKYFTETSIKLRRPKKLKHIEDIRARIERNEYKD
jgi:class 3 adenylate cyclase/ligand-binding sensor domain-containing protein/predicted metal-dependent HD superfamily phosphohydrolase